MLTFLISYVFLVKFMLYLSNERANKDISKAFVQTFYLLNRIPTH